MTHLAHLFRRIIILGKNVVFSRELLLAFTFRDIRARYSGSVLGIAWSILLPLCTFLIYALVFGFVLKIRLPSSDSIADYILFFSAGFFPWTFFNTAVVRASTSIIDNRHYIKKVPFPAAIFPVSIVLSELFSFGIMVAILIVFAYAIGRFGTYLFFLVPIVLLHTVLTASMALLFSAIGTFVRDLPHALGPLFMGWFWLTPITYPIDIVPKSMSHILAFNPMHHLIVLYREVIFYQRPPVEWKYLSALLASFIFISLSLAVFQRAKLKFSEVL